MISGSINQLDALEQYNTLHTNISDIMHTAGFAISEHDAHQLSNSVLYHVLGEKGYFDYLSILKFPAGKSNLN